MMTVEIFENHLRVEIEMATIDLCSKDELGKGLESDLFPRRVLSSLWEK
jgi:hypothetical protein